MSDVFFLAEFAGTPARSAQELASGAATLAQEAGGQAVGLAYGEGAADSAAALGTWGAARVIVLGDTTPPVITCPPPQTNVCGSAWAPIKPTALDACCGTSVTVSLVAAFTNTFAACVVAASTSGFSFLK